MLTIDPIAIRETLRTGQNTARFVVSNRRCMKTQLFSKHPYYQGLTFNHGSMCSMRTRQEVEPMTLIKIKICPPCPTRNARMWKLQINV